MLSTFRIKVVIVPINKLGDRDNLITFFFQVGQHGIQRLGGVFGTVMAEDDGTVAQMLVFADCADNGVHAVVFPV